MSRPPTLKDLARELGLSIPTVSLGLRHAGNVSEATCKRIQEAAKKMGYRPNPHAAALSSGARSKSQKGVPLAILRMPLNPQHDPYPIKTLIAGLTRRAGELGYRPEIFPLKDAGEIPRLLKTLHNRGFQGIFVPPIGQESLVESFDWSRFCVVACGRYDQMSPFHTVRQEIFESTRHLLSEVVRRGYSRIAMWLVEHDRPLLDDYAQEAAAGICRPPGGKRVHVMVVPSDENFGDLIRTIKSEKIDAVVGFHIGHYYAIQDSGLRIPEDLGFAVLHGNLDKWGEHIAGLLPRDEYCGVVAANRMDAMIRHHERGVPAVPEQIAIRGEWHDGTTLPVRRPA